MNRRSRRALALTTVGILLVAGTIAGGVWLGQRGDQQPAVTAPTSPQPTTPQPTGPEPTTQPTSPTVAGIWQRLPAAPIPAGVYEFAGVWSGRELLIYGAVHDRGGPHAAGAAYSPATGTWRKLPPAPSPVEVMEGGYRAVWTGTELLGSGMGLNAAYNPATNSWRRLSGTFGGSIWTGRQVLGWGGGCCGAVEAEGTAYTPATDTSQRLPRGPLAARETTMAWTGNELVIVGGKNLEGTTYADAAAYNPSRRTWRPLPPMPEPRAGATATWTGTEVLVVGGFGPSSNVRPYVRLYTDGVAYSPATNRWRHLPTMGDSGRTGHTATWTGRQLLVWGGQTLRADSWTTPGHGVVFDPSSNRWSALPKSVLRGRSGHVAVWTGTQMLIWGGNVVAPGGTVNDGAAYQPNPL
jgi:hypothetical protein